MSRASIFRRPPLSFWLASIVFVPAIILLAYWPLAPLFQYFQRAANGESTSGVEFAILLLPFAGALIAGLAALLVTLWRRQKSANILTALVAPVVIFFGLPIIIGSWAAAQGVTVTDELMYNPAIALSLAYLIGFVILEYLQDRRS